MAPPFFTFCAWFGYFLRMIDLHTHSLLSDGLLLPAELARRAEEADYRAIAITDHVDSSNIDTVVPALVRAAAELGPHMGIKIIPGAEITHVPPALIAALVGRARELGALIVIVHGETIAEPVAPGTNRAAAESSCDIISHPGLISDEDASLASERGVALEITARAGHGITNGHVAACALRSGAMLVLNTDAHAPGDLVTREAAMGVLLGAGLDDARAHAVFAYSEKLMRKALGG